MIYRGTIINGQVVLEERAWLPEGTNVRIEVECDESDESDCAAEPDQHLAQFWDALRGLAEKATTYPPEIGDRHFRQADFDALPSDD
jgi:hypothetical protein